MVLMEVTASLGALIGASGGPPAWESSGGSGMAPPDWQKQSPGRGLALGIWVGGALLVSPEECLCSGAEWLTGPARLLVPALTAPMCRLVSTLESSPFHGPAPVSLVARSIPHTHPRPLSWSSTAWAHAQLLLSETRPPLPFLLWPGIWTLSRGSTSVLLRPHGQRSLTGCDSLFSCMCRNVSLLVGECVPPPVESCPSLSAPCYYLHASGRPLGPGLLPPVQRLVCLAHQAVGLPLAEPRPSPAVSPPSPGPRKRGEPMFRNQCRE